MNFERTRSRSGCSEEELRAVCKELFIPQCDHGIDAHGAARLVSSTLELSGAMSG